MSKFEKIITAVTAAAAAVTINPGIQGKGDEIPTAYTPGEVLKVEKLQLRVTNEPQLLESEEGLWIRAIDKLNIYLKDTDCLREDPEDKNKGEVMLARLPFMDEELLKYAGYELDCSMNSRDGFTRGTCKKGTDTQRIANELNKIIRRIFVDKGEYTFMESLEENDKRALAIILKNPNGKNILQNINFVEVKIENNQVMVTMDFTTIIEQIETYFNQMKSDKETYYVI